MIRKALFTAALGALSFITPAEATFSGFYGGGRVYGVLWRDTHKFNAAGTEGNITLNIYSLKEYGVFAGYMMEVSDSKVMIGLEGYSDRGKTNSKVKSLGPVGGPIFGNVSFNHIRRIGIAAVVGKMISPKVMVYVKAARETGTYVAKYTLLAFPPSASQSITTKFKGTIPGIGGNYLVTKNLMVGVEYSFVGFYNQSLIRNDAFAAFTYKPVEHRLSFRVAFKI